MIIKETAKPHFLSRLITIVAQPSTLALAIATAVTATTFFWMDASRKPSQKIADSGRLNASTSIYFSVKDKADRAVPGAAIEAVGKGSIVTTDNLGNARVMVSDSRMTAYRISAPGFKDTEQIIQAPREQPNVAVLLSPETEPVSKYSEKQIAKPPLEPYEEEFRSGPVPSGRGEEFSPWYEVIAAPPKPRYVIDEQNLNYALVGDRHCNAWSECRILSSPTEVIFRFRMQGHTESFGGAALSEGILHVRYKPTTTQ